MTGANIVNDEIISPPDKGMADTPDMLADAAVRAIGVSGATSWLEPCAGSGQIIEAVLRAGVSPNAVFAVDLQTQLPALDRLGVESLPGTDFISWAHETDRRFDRVIANPPFVRLSKLHEALLCPAIDTRLDGVHISGTANYWVAFLLAGMKLLQPGGSMSYILPAAWEYADYANPLRVLCSSSFRELDVHRVSEPMFDEVEDGSVLLVGRGFGEQPSRDVQVFRYGTLSDLSIALRTDATLKAVGQMRCQDVSLKDNEVRMGDIAEIRIGAVTGDAQFFLLTESRREELRLPRSAVRPILSRSEHLVKSEIDQEAWQDLLDDDKRVWLFDPSNDDLEDRSVQAYINLKREDGGCHRAALKVMSRDPWYRVPLPPTFDGFVSGMSQATPWVTLNRMSDLAISNTLYGVSFPSLKSVDDQAAWCLSMLSSKTTRSRELLAREYPQGLLKLEPRDFASLAVQRPTTTEDARSLYRQAVDLITSGCRDRAQAMVDEWLGEEN